MSNIFNSESSENPLTLIRQTLKVQPNDDGQVVVTFTTAKFVNIVCYHSCILAEEAAGEDCWEIISINASAVENEPIPTETLLRTYTPHIDIRTPIAGHGTCWDIAHAKAVLGWEPAHSWRDAD